MSFTACSSLLLMALAPSTVPTQADETVLSRIREEGMSHSQVAKTLSYLTDVIGERLTGSPSLKRANEFTRDTLTGWGLSNAHLESWGPFGRGWQLDRFSAQVTAPLDIPLIAFPKAWSPSLRGPATADVVLVDIKDEKDLAAFKGKLKGKIVLNGGETPVPARFTPQGSRYTDEELAALKEPQAPRGAAGGRRGAAGGPGGQRPNMALAGVKLRFFMDEGALAVFDGSRSDDGTIFVQSATVPPPGSAPTPAPTAGATPTPPRRGPSVWDKSAPKTLPQVTVASEHYNRMVRMIQQGVNLKVNLDLKTSFYDKDLNAYNTVAELPGTDLKDQIVMAGGHMDSWHSGTGATDNGAGVVVAMEAVRILKALNLQPRRTVRVALWSGEEEGLFGSQAYVTQHLGSYPKPAANGFPGGGAPEDRGPLTKGPEYDKVSAYFNLDNGTGKIRGIYCQSNSAVAPIFADWLKPFADLGASTVTLRNTGSTDHVSFDAVGVPGFQFIQDTIEYNTRTHHSNQDVFDRIQIDDLKQASVILATFLYNTAMRDEKLPRKPVSGS